jgi:23S rRNA (adenine1618-N6)-methyltransferase
MDNKNDNRQEKSELHPRNKHKNRYDFQSLINSCVDLKPYVHLNKFGDESIDFANADAVKMLNKALLKHFYTITDWNIPDGYLCPPIPGRADYIHYVADVLAINNKGIVPTGKNIKCLDIGVGANCVYPIIGNSEYGWCFVGADIDEFAIESASKWIEKNATLKDGIELRLQLHPKNIFKGIIKENERFDVTICNPPFHLSLAEAQAGTLRKLNNLNHKKAEKATLNFGGKNNELWCDGGEIKFIQNMIAESKIFANNCCWFSTLVSKESNLKGIYAALKQVKATAIKTIPMATGNKISRIVVWTFLTKEKQQIWHTIK